MKIPAVIMKYKWVILAVVIVIGVAIYLSKATTIIQQDPGVMHGPENHPLNVELTEIRNKQVKCFQDLNKQKGKDASYRPDGFFETIEYASTCITIVDLSRIGQLETELQSLISQDE